MRKIFATLSLCCLSLALVAGCTPDADDDIDLGTEPVVIDAGTSGNMTSSAMTPSGNMTSTADVPVVTEVPE